MVNRRPLFSVAFVSFSSLFEAEVLLGALPATFFGVDPEEDPALIEP